MTPIFWLIVLILAVLLWFVISFIFVPIGTWVYNIFHKTMNNLLFIDENKKDKTEEKEKE